MSREIAPVGQTPGRYHVSISIPRLPLDPGLYQINLHLVMPDPERPTQRIALDGWSWFNGDGLELDVTGASAGGLSLPLRWTATTRDSVSA
jgi:lipopolysaccharide transport system ATP-binding protein